MTRRRIEVMVATASVAAAASFTAAILVWHFGFDDVWWSLPFPDADGSNASELYGWAELILLVAFAAVWLIAAVLFAMRRRRSGASILSFVLPILVACGCAVIYWPFFSVLVRRVDRVRHFVKEPAFAFRRLAVLLALTLVLSLLYLFAASLRRAPPLGGRVARVAIIILAGVYLHIIWIPMLLPAVNDWQPLDWQEPDRLVPFRPCRGALLWLTRSDGKIVPIARIDDLWLRFADPRRGGQEERAVSAPLEMVEGYTWLSMAEAERLSLRYDDPAVRHCDSRWENQRVRPASWHKLGVK